MHGRALDLRSAASNGEWGMRAILLPFRPIGQLLYLLFGGLFVLLVVTLVVLALVIAPIFFAGYYGAKLGFWLITVLVVSVSSTSRRLHRWYRVAIVAVHAAIGSGDWFAISWAADRYRDTYLTFVVDIVWKAIGWIAPTVFGAMGLSCASPTDPGACKNAALNWTRSADVALAFSTMAATLSSLGVLIACLIVLRDRYCLRMIEA